MYVNTMLYYIRDLSIYRFWCLRGILASISIDAGGQLIGWSDLHVHILRTNY